MWLEACQCGRGGFIWLASINYDVLQVLIDTLIILYNQIMLTIPIKRENQLITNYCFDLSQKFVKRRKKHKYTNKF